MTGHVISFDVGVRNLGVAASAVEPNGDATLLWLDTADITAACADRCVQNENINSRLQAKGHLIWNLFF